MYIAAVSCSLSVPRLGGVKFVFWLTGKLGRAWVVHGILAGPAGPCMALVHGGASGVVHGWCARWGLGKSICILEITIIFFCRTSLSRGWAFVAAAFIMIVPLVQEVNFSPSNYLARPKLTVTSVRNTREIGDINTDLAKNKCHLG